MINGKVYILLLWDIDCAHASILGIIWTFITHSNMYLEFPISFSYICIEIFDNFGMSRQLLKKVCGKYVGFLSLEAFGKFPSLWWI